MKSNKGFTLIELLAVIVILAIIALIATPIILDVIDTAKKGAKESSALGYVDAVEKQVMIAQVTPENADDFDTTEAVIYDADGLISKGVEVKGDQPKSGTFVEVGTKGEVTRAIIVFDDYTVYYTPALQATAAKGTTIPESYSALSGMTTTGSEG